MTITINPAYNRLSEYLQHIPLKFDNEGDIIYDKRNTLRRITAPDGTILCIKRYHTPRLLNHIVYTLFREPKAQRAYQNAIRLAQLDIPTPQPVAYILCNKHGFIADSYLITLYSPLRRNMYEFDNGDIHDREHILQAFAQLTADIHNHGIIHSDYSPGNILFDDNNGKVEFSIIDINRMQFRNVDMNTGCRNLQRLWGTPDTIRYIAELYAEARHFDTQRCIELTLRYWRHFWQHRQHHFPIY